MVLIYHSFCFNYNIDWNLLPLLSTNPLLYLIFDYQDQNYHKRVHILHLLFWGPRAFCIHRAQLWESTVKRKRLSIPKKPFTDNLFGYLVFGIWVHKNGQGPAGFLPRAYWWIAARCHGHATRIGKETHLLWVYAPWLAIAFSLCRAVPGWGLDILSHKLLRGIPSNLDTIQKQIMRLFEDELRHRWWQKENQSFLCLQVSAVFHLPRVATSALAKTILPEPFTQYPSRQKANEMKALREKWTLKNSRSGCLSRRPFQGWWVHYRKGECSSILDRYEFLLGHGWFSVELRTESMGWSRSSIDSVTVSRSFIRPSSINNAVCAIASKGWLVAVIPPRSRMGESPKEASAMLSGMLCPSAWSKRCNSINSSKGSR